MIQRKHFLYNALYTAVTAVVSFGILITAPEHLPVPKTIYLPTTQKTLAPKNAPVPVLLQTPSHLPIGVIRVSMYLQDEEDATLKNQQAISLEAAREAAAKSGADGIIPARFGHLMRGALSNTELVAIAVKDVSTKEVGN